MADMITTGVDNEQDWTVLERTSRGDPLVVRHAEPPMRGSFLEAWMNVAFALREFKVELHAALPRWARQRIPEPRAWWI